MSSERNNLPGSENAPPRPVTAGAAAAALPSAPVARAAAVTSPLHVLLLWGGLIVGALLLLALPLAKPTWTDEYISILWGERSLLDILLGRATSPDALPMHPLLMHATYTLFGDNLAAFRVASALPSAVGLWFVYLLGRRFSDRVGLFALWLCALSPGLLLYDRMARYHGLTALLSTVSVWAALRLLDTGKARDAVLFGVVTWVMLMSYALSMFVVVAELGFLLLLWDRQPVRGRRWLLAAAACAAGALFLPFLANAVLRASHSGMTQVAVEDPEVGQGLGGFVRRFALPAYVFCVGETVYPWTWLVSVPGVLASLAAFLLGVRALWRGRRPEVLLPLACFLVVLLSALATSGKFGAGQTLGSMAKRVSFALPLFYVTLSVGVFSLAGGEGTLRRRAGALLAAVLVLVSLYSVRNYWTGREFLNPNYTAPWDEALATMRRVRPLGPDTYVFSRGELALDFALRGSVRGAAPAGVLADNQVGTPEDVARDLAAHPAVRYVWVVARDRGDRTAVDAFERIRTYLDARYRRAGSYGVMPRSASERHWFRKFMHRDAAPDYIWMDLYDTEAAR